MKKKTRIAGKRGSRKGLPEARSLPRPWVHGARAFWAAAILVPPLLLAWLVWRFGVDVPKIDEWSLPYDIDRYLTGQWTWSDILRSHNGHRIAIPRLIMVPLAAWSGWNIRIELALNLVAGAALFACFGRAIRDLAPTLSRSGVAALTALTSWAVFSLSQWENWIWGTQIQVILGMAFAVCGLLVASRDRLTPGSLALAAAAGLGSMLCQAIGLAFWFAAAPLVASPRGDEARRVTVRRVLLWLAFGLAACAVYFVRLPGDANVPSRLFILEHPWAFARWTASALAAPLVPFTGAVYPPRDDGWASIVGAAGVVAWALFAFRSFRRGDSAPWRFLHGAGAFAFGTIALAGLARGGSGPSTAFASRYATLALPFWIALGAEFARRGFSSSGGEPVPIRSRWPARLAFVLVSGGVVVGSAWSLPAFESLARLLEPARQALAAGSPEWQLKRLHGEVWQVRNGSVPLEEHGLSVFRPDSTLCRSRPDPAAAVELRGGLGWLDRPAEAATIGWPIRLRLAVRNDSAAAWPAVGLDESAREAVRVLAYWADGRGRRRDPSAELPLPVDLGSGREARIDGFVPTPQTPGDYRLELFVGRVGAPTSGGPLALTAPIRVREGLVAGPWLTRLHRVLVALGPRSIVRPGLSGGC